MGSVPAGVRWLGAVIVLGLVVVVSVPMLVEALGQAVVFDTGEAEDEGLDAPDPAAEPDGDVPASPEPEAEAEPPSGPVEDGVAQPVVDFAARGGQVRELAGERLPIGAEPGDAVFVACERIDGDPSCIERVELELELVESSPTELGAYAAAPFTVEDLSDGSELPADPLLSGLPGSLAFTDGSTGRLLWDLTGLYEQWSASADVPADAPLIVLVRPTADDDPDRSLAFASGDDEDDAPTLAWTGLPGCPAE